MKHGTAADIPWFEDSYIKGQKLDDPASVDFKYVLIPGEKMESKGLSQRKTKRIHYAEVMAVFVLKG